MKPYLSRITIYPFKSLSGLNLSQVTILKNGALENDRRFVLMNKEDQYITGRSYPKIHLLDSRYDIETRMLHLRENRADNWFDFHIDTGRKEMEKWLSCFFETSVRLQEHDAGGFPDDLEYPGATVISTATLESVAAWYTDITLEQIRMRFRANLEIGGVPPFWEDHLFKKKGERAPFQIGNVCLWGMNPCARCVIPTRNPETGEAIKLFQKDFTVKRQAELPTWAEPSRFDHYYRLAVNTSIDPENKSDLLQVGDEVTLDESC